MFFSQPLIEARLIRRYKRFLADMTLPDGTVVTAHSVNTGAMTGVLDEGNRVWLSESDNPARKLKYTWELVEAEGTLMGINTSLTNRLAEEAIGNGAIPELAGYSTLRREVRYGSNSRIDLLLQQDGLPDCYVEVKNVHWKQGELATFPDAVTSRGAKHMAELATLAEAGTRAVVLFVVQRDDCAAFAPAASKDPAYAAALHNAVAKGVEALAYCCYVAPDEIRIHRPLSLEAGV
jgi:sugar fermentation stimulation protein A